MIFLPDYPGVFLSQERLNLHLLIAASNHFLCGLWGYFGLHMHYVHSAEWIVGIECCNRNHFFKFQLQGKGKFWHNQTSLACCLLCGQDIAVSLPVKIPPLPWCDGINRIHCNGIESIEIQMKLIPCWNWNFQMTWFLSSPAIAASLLLFTPCEIATSSFPFTCHHWRVDFLFMPILNPFGEKYSTWCSMIDFKGTPLHLLLADLCFSCLLCCISFADEVFKRDSEKPIWIWSWMICCHGFHQMEEWKCLPKNFVHGNIPTFKVFH
jgi:hypothetical protein